jgi:hypothetical protein
MKRIPHVGIAAALALFLAACAGDPKPPPVDPTAGVGSEYSPGSHVLVNRGGSFVPAVVLQATLDNRFVVRYDGYGPQYDEPVATDRLRPYTPPSPYKVGDCVLVTAQNRTILADVLQDLGNNTFRVHYDGYGPEVAENVTPERIKKPFTGATAHQLNEAVFVEVNGAPLPAKIAAVVAADRWIVRFDGFNAQYDQEVGADRFRAAPPPAVATPAPPPPPEPVAKDDDKKGKGKKGKKDKDPPKDDKPAAPAAPAAPTGGPLQAGEAVLVSQRGGSWVPATISAAGASGAWKVKYTSGGEEEVAADRVGRANGPLKGTPYTPNMPIFIEWHGAYYAGKVVKEGGAKGQYKVRFEGTGPEADEVVNSNRIRPR